MTSAPLASFSAANPLPRQSVIPIPPTTPAPVAPPNMTVIPGNASWLFVVEGIEIEGGNRVGVDFRYPGEVNQTRSHSLPVAIAPFYINTYPVTNAEFAAFLAASGWWPPDVGAQ